MWVDDIATPLRDWVWAEKRGGTESFLGRLIQCPWCIAPWVAAPLTAVTFLLTLAPAWAQLTWNGMLTVAAVSMFGSWITQQSEA